MRLFAHSSFLAHFLNGLDSIFFPVGQVAVGSNKIRSEEENIDIKHTYTNISIE